MKLIIQVATPFLMAASFATSVMASPTSPSRTIRVRQEQQDIKVVLPPGGSWSKAGPMVKRNTAAVRRAVPFGSAPAPLLVRAPQDSQDDEVEYVDCSDYQEGEDDEGDEGDDEESQDKVGYVGGASTSPSSASSAPADPAPSSSSAAQEIPAPVTSTAEPSSSIDWSQFSNPKVVKPAETPAIVASSAPSGVANSQTPSASQVSNPSNLATGSLTAEQGCIRFWTVTAGENCFSMRDISNDLGLTLDQFYSYNPSVDTSCSNLLLDTAYCIGKKQ